MHDQALPRRYRLSEARRLLPLIQAIAREMQERRNARRRLSRALVEGRFGERAVHAMRNRLADHEDGLDEARAELLALGLSTLRVDPLTIHIPGATARGDVVFCWQEGDLDITHGHEVGAEDEPRRPLRIRASSPSRGSRGDGESTARRTG